VRPTETLRHEHSVVLLVVGAAERESASIRERGAADRDRVGKMVDFFKGFVDLCHHAKEEKHLFPLVRERAPDAAALVDALLAEHEEGRRHVREVGASLDAAAAGDGPAKAVAAGHLSDYAALLRTHIEKEDNDLFVRADVALTSDDEATLAEAFERVETEETGAGVHEKYHAVAHELAGLPAPEEEAPPERPKPAKARKRAVSKKPVRARAAKRKKTTGKRTKRKR